MKTKISALGRTLNQIERSNGKNCNTHSNNVKSRKAAIEQHCRDCIFDPNASGTWREQVGNCTSINCSLRPFRPTPLTGTKKKRSSILVRENNENRIVSDLLAGNSQCSVDLVATDREGAAMNSQQLSRNAR